MQETILIVEDEQDILDLLEYTLTKDGYDTICCTNTSNIISILDEEDISLILMDRNLPNIEGSVFIKYIRKKGYNNLVLYLSAKDKDKDILDGFKSGGDDYITKPFNLELLKARVKALIKRDKKKQDVLKFKDIIYNFKNKKIFISNKEIKLTSLEHNLLLEFLKNQDILLSRDILLDNVWGDYTNTKPKTVNVALKRLKEKIDPTGEKQYIKAVRGEGYIMENEWSFN
jgi:DNA-binding response OmpR family regulator